VINVFATYQGSDIMELTQLQWLKYAIMHPFDGYDNMRWKKSGSLKIAFIIVAVFFFAVVAQGRFYGFQFHAQYDKTFSIIPYFVRSVVIFSAWVIGNWSVCTLLNGEGTMKNICIYSAYALAPYVIQIIINVILSHLLIRDEYIFMLVIKFVGVVWSLLLTFSAIKTVHQYSPAKTIAAIFLTVASMALMLVIAVLLLSLFQQVYVFINSVYTEISYRIRS
jgi:hypothetical protein